MNIFTKRKKIGQINTQVDTYKKVIDWNTVFAAIVLGLVLLAAFSGGG